MSEPIEDRVERVRSDLYRVVDENEVELEVVSVICDSCNEFISGSLDEVTIMTHGWQLGQHGAGKDYCAGCIG